MRTITLLTSALVAFSPKEVVIRKGNELAARESLSGISRAHLAKQLCLLHCVSSEVKKTRTEIEYIQDGREEALPGFDQLDHPQRYLRVKGKE